MKTKLLLFIASLFIMHHLSYAQKNISGSVKGILTDTTFNDPMAGATVSVLESVDSSIISYALADTKGAFLIKNLSPGAYLLLISFQGYTTVYKQFSVTATDPETDLGIINMNKADNTLDEVIIQRPPINVKGDTVEFTASAFKTKPNAVAEDLLKKIPGVEVDMDGNVTAQGETVQKVYIDGKEFFGNDAKMATKNITADMIESVQVFEDMSDQAKFTGIDDGSRSKTINIKLKKNRKQGYFGKSTIGLGNDNLYLGNIMLNRFNNDRRVTILGSANNLNKQSFNSRDIISGMGGFSGGNNARDLNGSMGNGIASSNSLGINYTDVVAGKLQVQGSYMYSEIKNRTNESSFRKTLFAEDTVIHTRDSVTYANDERHSYNINRSHNFNLRLEYKIDSMNSLLYTPTLTLQHSDDNGSNTNDTKISVPGLEYHGLNSDNKNVNNRKGTTLNNELLYRRRFNKRGRTFTVGFKNTLNQSDGSGTNYSLLTFYKPGGTIDKIRERDFLSSQTTKSSNYVMSSSYTEPLGKNKILEVNYAYTDNMSTSDRTAFSYNSNTKKYDSINAQQTNYFKNIFIAHRLGLNFRYSNRGYGFQAGLAMQASSLDNNSVRGIYSTIGKDTVIRTQQSYINFFPTANFNYDFKKKKNIRIRYQGRTNQPNVRQLQDVRDETRALRTITGNPGLKQEFNNRLNISYKSFNEHTFRYINLNVNYNQTSNKIVNSIDHDTVRGAGVQLVKPINLNGTFDASYDVSFGVPLRKGVKGSSINIGNRMRYGREVSRLYSKNNFTNSFSASQSLGLNLDIKEKLNMEFKGRYAYNSVKYSAQQNKSVNLNSEYFSQSYSTDINLYVLKSLILSTDFNYSISSGRADGYNQSVPLWNGGIACLLFPKKNGELKLSVSDILNQNSNSDRRIGENYILDSRTEILQRYYLLTFTYNFNRFGGQKGSFNQRNGMQRSGGKRKN